MLELADKQYFYFSILSLLCQEVIGQTTLNVSLTFDREQNSAKACASVDVLSKMYTFSIYYLYKQVLSTR